MKKVGSFAAIIILDQLVKLAVIKNLLGSKEVFLNNFVCNSVLSWSIPVQGAMLFVLWLIAVGFLVCLACRYRWNFYLILALAGAVSNLIDRIRIGCVIDFIKLPYFPPTFNLADIAITLGIFAFVICLISSEKPKKEIC